jgi:AraC-like DNA-binding protein
MHKRLFNITVIVFVYLISCSYLSYGNELFYTSFETSPLLTADTLAPGSDKISLIYDNNIEQWPKSGGSGIIQGFNPNVCDTFVYSRRKGITLYKVKGLNFPHPPYSDIRSGTLKPWTEKSPPIALAREPYYGLYAAQVTSPESTYTAITHYIPERNDFWVSYYVKFSSAFLNSLSLGTFNLFHEVKDNNVFEGFVKVGIGRWQDIEYPCLIFILPYSGKSGDTLNLMTHKIEADRYYGIEYHYSDQVFENFLNGEKCGSFKTGSKKNPNVLHRLRFFTYDRAPFWIDEARVTTERFGFITPQPGPPELVSGAGMDTLLFKFDREKYPLSKYFQAWISRQDNWDCEVFNSGKIELASPLFKLPVKALPEKGTYFIRMRHKSVDNNWGDWSRPAILAVTGADSASFAKKDYVKKVVIRDLGKTEDLDRIQKNQWYTLEISIDPDQWNDIRSMEIYLQRYTYLIGNSVFLGGPFSDRDNYLFRFDLKVKSIWVKEREKVVSLSEYSGRKGKVVDGTDTSFIVDTLNHKACVNFKLTEAAEPGLWYVRTSNKTGGYKRTFILTPQIKEKSLKPIFVILLINAVFIIIILVVFILYRKKHAARQNQRHIKLVNDVNDFILRNIQTSMTVKQIADHMGMSESNLRKIYKKAGGKQIKVHMLEARMDTAKKLLSETDDNISEILFKLGFNDPSYFSRQFRKYFGMTPQEFRRKKR